MSGFPTTHMSAKHAFDMTLPWTETDVWISDEICRVLQWVMIAVANQIFSLLGTATNILNIICFLKQGIKDSVTINLFALAISDLGCLITLIFSNLCYTPAFQESDLPFDSVELQYLLTGWPHVIFARITSWITALITIERCLCITIPLKVKTLVTPKRVAIIICSIFLLFICMGSPVYYVNSLRWQFSPERNRTILRLVINTNNEIVDTVTFTLTVFMPFGAFVVVIGCTTLLVVSLQRKSRWRESSSFSLQARTISSTRDQKVARMVVIMSTLFIVCYFPMCVLYLGMIFVPGLSPHGKNKNTAFAIGFIAVFLETTNSAMNIFIYYTMSSKYRLVLRKIFCIS